MSIDNKNPASIIDSLYEVLQSRKSSTPEESYVSSLYKKGAGKIADKIEEEAKEMIAEALLLENKVDDETVKAALKSETADLLFHILVMLAYYDINPNEILSILENRFGTSGHVEKASRSKNK